ncbi:MAG: hypothetical protein LBL75_02585 [Rickettsiales bacterium]|jgi:hypothetical protein|nr:hypothetical protein [Rickettsiales bacterium]
MIDYHLHYTGSLPHSYVFHNLTIQKPEFLVNNNINSAADLSVWINRQFSKNYIQNRVVFNKIYELFQSVSKPKDEASIVDTYKNGTYEIANCVANNGIKKYAIVAGPTTEIKTTIDRYVGIIHGFKKSEIKYANIFGKIIITFIHGNDGKFKNLSDKLLCDIFDCIKNGTFANRIFGFDISGYEYPDKELLSDNINLIKKIININDKFGLNLDIGLHAGEIITTTQDDRNYDDYFTELSKLNINTIRHGTYLWHNNKRNILQKFAGRTTFDLSSKSSVLLTPAKTIPLNLFNELGIDYRLGRDDPSILNNWQR